MSNRYTWIRTLMRNRASCSVLSKPVYFARRGRKIVLTAVLALLLISHHAHTCGIQWSMPAQGFEGVSDRGFVSLWHQVGTVNFANDFDVPLIVGFQSDRNATSPELGSGWVMPLFSSSVVQTDENSFEMLLPDGNTVRLYRRGASPTVIESGDRWKGEIKGNDIVVSASCGWVLSFSKGRLSELKTPQNKSVKIRRAASGIAEEITCDGNPVLRVRHDEERRKTILSANGKEFSFTKRQRPIVQNINSKNIVARMEESLGSVYQGDSCLLEFDYPVDDSLAPQIVISQSGHERKISWDPLRLVISRDGEWKYEIAQDADLRSNVEIKRTNSRGTEHRFYDSAKGVLTTKSADGLKTVKSWFVTGDLAGRLRKVVVVGRDGSETVLEKYFYDQKGRLLRKCAGPYVFEYSADTPNRISAITINGNELYSQGRIIQNTTTKNNQL